MVEITRISVPNFPTQGSTVTGSFTVETSAGATESTTLAVAVDGSRVASVSVQVAPGESAQYEFDYVVPCVGTGSSSERGYTVTVGSQQAPTVAGRDQTGPCADEPESEPEPECTSDADCSGDLVCQDGTCVEPEAPETPEDVGGTQSIESCGVSPQETVVGEEISFQAQVSNSAASEQTVTVEWVLPGLSDAPTIGTDEVTLPAEGSAMASTGGVPQSAFLSPVAARILGQEASSECGTLNVMESAPAADVTITGCQMNPLNVAVGEQVGLQATLSNTTDSEQSVRVEWVLLARSGNPLLASDELTIAAGGTATASASVTPQAEINSEVGVRRVIQ